MSQHSHPVFTKGGVTAAKQNQFDELKCSIAKLKVGLRASAGSLPRISLCIVPCTWCTCFGSYVC